MAVSLYTVRVVLDVLGEEDYGIYNVVGGFVAMFNILSGAFVGGNQPFHYLRDGAARCHYFAIAKHILFLFADTNSYGTCYRHATRYVWSLVCRI